MFKAIVLDMDGLMVDTERIVFENWSYISEKHGYDLTLELFRKTIGLRRVETERLLKSVFGDDFPYLAIADECHEMFIEKTDRGGIPVKKGLTELLDFAKQSGMGLAVATSTRRHSAERVLKLAGVFDRFDAIICGEDVTKGKPDPEVFLTAAKKLGAEPCECVGMEDSISGVKAISRAGMFTVMVPDLIEPSEEILPMVDLLCADLSEAAAYLRSNKYP